MSTEPGKASNVERDDRANISGVAKGLTARATRPDSQQHGKSKHPRFKAAKTAAAQTSSPQGWTLSVGETGDH